MKKIIPHAAQSLNTDDYHAVIDILRSELLTQGSPIPRFESAVSHSVGVKFGVATSSATAALHIACRALGLGPGDWLWTSPNTFVASSNCGLYCNARIDFVDINPKTYNISGRKR